MSNNLRPRTKDTPAHANWVVTDIAGQLHYFKDKPFGLFDHPTIEELEPHTVPANNIDRAAPIGVLGEIERPQPAVPGWANWVVFVGQGLRRYYSIGMPEWLPIDMSGQLKIQCSEPRCHVIIIDSSIHFRRLELSEKSHVEGTGCTSEEAVARASTAAPIQELRALIKRNPVGPGDLVEMLKLLKGIDRQRLELETIVNDMAQELQTTTGALSDAQGDAQVVSMMRAAIDLAGLELYDLPGTPLEGPPEWGLRPKGGAPIDHAGVLDLVRQVNSEFEKVHAVMSGILDKAGVPRGTSAPGRSPVADLTWTPVPDVAWKYAAPSRFEVDRKAIFALLEDQYQTFTVLCGSHATDCAINIAKATELYRVKVADWDVVQHVLTAYVKAVAARHGTGEWIAQNVAAEQLLAVTELVQELKKQGAP